jgi:hypothetical protein
MVAVTGGGAGELEQALALRGGPALRELAAAVRAEDGAGVFSHGRVCH